MNNSLRDKVLETVDIVAVIGERVQLTRKGREYVGLCPFHPDHKPSLSVSPTKRIFKCWSCNEGGDVIRFIQRIERVEFREALASLARRAGIEVQVGRNDARENQARDRVLAATAWARQHFQRNLTQTPGGRAAREYAVGRGLTDETIARFGLGFAVAGWDDLLKSATRAGIDLTILHQAGLVTTNEQKRSYDRFRNRLIFPILDAVGRPIAFGGRALDDDAAKYLNSPETVLFSKSRVLYGLDLARKEISKQSAAIVVEGYMDAVMLSQYGFTNVLATLGTALTDAHVKLLGPIARTVFLCFDSDDAGVRAADRAVEITLRSPLNVRVIVLEGAKDPADLLAARGAEGFAQQLTKAVDALEFKWSQALRAFDHRDQRARTLAIQEFLGFVAGAADSGGVDAFQQDLIVGRLSELVGVPPAEVFDLLLKERRGRRAVAARPTGAAELVSEYEHLVRGLPAGFVMAVETVIGLVLRDGSQHPAVEASLSDASLYCPAWQRLHRVLLEVGQTDGEYFSQKVVERCDDGDLCELLSRATARVTGLELTTEVVAAARERLTLELATLHQADLRREIHAGGQDDEQAYDALRQVARSCDRLIPPDRHWNTAIGPNSGSVN